MRIDTHANRRPRFAAKPLHLSVPQRPSDPPSDDDLLVLRPALKVIVRALRGAQPEQLSDFMRLLSTAPDGTAQDESDLVAALAELASPGAPARLIDPEQEIPDDARRKLLLYRQRVGHAIRDRRVELAMTQADLAAKSGIPQSHISRLENGQHTPSYLTMESLAKAMNTERATLDPGLDDLRA